MLQGINPLLTGDLLKHLDEMGHSESVVVVDAHFPAAGLADRLVTLPGTTAPEVVAAIRSVLPLDDVSAVDLMRSADGTVLDVQHQLLDAAGIALEDARFVDRFAFYDVAAEGYLIVRTGETRKYGNALLRKGIVTA